MPVTPSGRRLLVDECVDHKLLGELRGHSTRTVQEMGFAGIKNGSLLELAAAEFDVLFTVDRYFAGVADTLAERIGIVILHIGSTSARALLPYMPSVNDAIREVEPGRVRRITAHGRARPS